MLHQPLVRPFGDDDDANRAISSVLSIVADLSKHSQKLARTSFRDINAEKRQREMVRELQDRIVSRARSVHVDPAEFLEKARIILEKKVGRAMPIIPIGARPAEVDDDTRRLEGELLDAQTFEQRKLKALSKARAEFSDAQAATRIAQAVVDARYAQKRKAA